MRAERISIFIVVLVVLVALAVPASRKYALIGFEHLSPVAERSVWTGIANPVVHGPKSKEQLAREHPKDYLLRLGVALRSKDESQDKAFDVLLRDFPNEPSVYALAMMSDKYSDVDAPNRIEEWGITPESAAKSYADIQKAPWRTARKSRKDESASLLRLLALLDAGSRIDPDNGFFKYRRAVCLFALHRDKEALEAVHQAAASPVFTGYRDIAAKAIDRLWDARGGFDPVNRSNAYFLLDGLQSKERNVAKIIQHIAYTRIKTGDADGGVRLAMHQMAVGHQMATNATEFMSAFMGIALVQIGAGALDPMADLDKIKDRATRQKLSERGERRKRELEFLKTHGYHEEAAELGKWTRDRDRIVGAIHTHLDAKGPGSTDDLIRTLSVFSQSYRTGVRLLAMCVLALAVWLVAGTLGLWKRFDGVWDRRAAVAAVALAILPLGVMVELLLEAVTDPVRGFGAVFGAFVDSATKTDYVSSKLGIKMGSTMWLHWTLIGIALGCLVVGLVLAFRRSAMPGKRPMIPARLLLAAYAAVFALVIENAHGAMWSSYDAAGAVTWSYLIWPALLLAAYSLFRAFNCRFSCVKQSFPATFIATLRYGAVLAAAVFMIAYAALMPVTVVIGARADTLARAQASREATVIRNAASNVGR